MTIDTNTADAVGSLQSAGDLQAVADVVRHAARTIARSQGATFVLRDGDRCFYADEDSVAPLWKGQRFPMRQCVSGWAMMHDDVALVADIEDDARIPLEVYRSTYVRSLVMVPIGTPPVGAIGAYWSRTGLADPDCVEHLRSLASATADAIDRIGLDAAPWAPTFAADDSDR